ncbi:MAG: LysM peptidoglycan-binding domain-containing protein [Desulfurivibrio sp.]|nr:LysM peptidoglycan-binding domain-containing protein [Desulfurivibrio sp.]
MEQLAPPATTHPRRHFPWMVGAVLVLLLNFWGCAPLSSPPAEAPPTTTAAIPPTPVTPSAPAPARSKEPSTAAPQVSGEELELTPAEPDRFLEEEVAKFQELGDWDPEGEKGEETTAATYDFPVIVNKHVQFYLDYFQNELRPTFSRWLSRSGRYLPMIQQRLREAGLPEDLAYLPMIESGFSLTAYSRSRAVGPWQFMAATARHYGLQINEYTDERRDPIKSTEAAIAFLGDLYQEFDNWHLAVAAYNGGNGRVRKAIRQLGSEDFWKISQRNHLPRETRHYVPKLIAAIIIAKNPAEYGFDNITYDEPLRYETIEVPRWTSLEAVAAAGDLDLDELHELNRQLRRRVTPPDMPRYTLRLPTGSKEAVAANFSPGEPQKGLVLHTVQPGESLWLLARRYGTSAETIASWNNLNDPSRIRVGQQLAFYFPPDSPTTTERQLPAKRRPRGERETTHYQVRGGDTLWSIARRFQTTPELIRQWNQLNGSLIHPGTRLVLKLGKRAS